MALKKQKEFKGYLGEYWKITKVNLELMTSTLSCELGLFKDKLTRDNGEDNKLTKEKFTWTIPEEYSNVASMTVYELIAYVYSKIKESKIVKVPILDENGFPSGDYTEKESNWFFDAEDILEIV